MKVATKTCAGLTYVQDSKSVVFLSRRYSLEQCNEPI